MKRITVMVVLLLCLTQCLFSCAKQYQVEYPDHFTNEYCTKSFVSADPNLLYLERAEKSPSGSPHTENGAIIKYYAIRDISPEDYLAMNYYMIFSEASNTMVRIVKNPDFGIDEYELFTKKIAGAEIYKRKAVEDSEFIRAGTDCYESQIAKLTDAQIDDLIDHIEVSLNSQQYSECELFSRGYYKPGAGGHSTVLRVYFEEYDYMVWDAIIAQKDGAYFIVFYVYDDSPEPSGIRPGKQWRPVYITLPAEIAELIPEME